MKPITTEQAVANAVKAAQQLSRALSVLRANEATPDLHVLFNVLRARMESFD